jgi:hypothetical protein
MSPEKEAYEEALRRIRKTEETGAVELDHTNETAVDRNTLAALRPLPPELARLTSLQRLTSPGSSISTATSLRWRD